VPSPPTAPSSVPTSLAPLFGARFDPPRRRSSDIDRTALLTSSDDGNDARLLVISAPAGYGKSTLAAQLDAVDLVRNRMWHAVEPIDNDPVAFTARLLAGLERLAPFSPEMRAAAERSTTQADTDVIPMLLSVMRQREPLRITFDDAHHLASPASLSMLQQIITGIGQHSQVAIATRVTPDLGLARLRAAGDLAEIGPHQLAMDLDATSDVLGRLGIELDTADVESLHQQTEGWPAGLALAGIAISNSPTSGAPVIPSGRRREIADYLVDEVLSQLSDEVRSFLVRIALLRRFNAQLCDAMLGREGSHDLLDRLDRINLFVVPLDDERGWYRFHHLFGELLNDQFERMGAPERSLLLNRAALWHLQHGTIDEALHYAQRSGDFALAGRIALGHGPRLIRAGQIDTLRSWIERSTNDEITSDAAFCIAAAGVAALLGESKAHRFVHAAEQLPLDGPSPDGASSLRASFTNVRAMIGEDGFERMLADGQQVYELERAAHSPWMTGGCRAMGFALVGLGRPDEAIPILREGLRLCAEFSIDGYQELVFLGHLALAHLDLSDFTKATDRVEEGSAILVRSDVSRPVHALALWTAEASIAWRRGDLDRARRALARVEQHLDLAAAMVWYEAEVAVRCAETAWAFGDEAIATRFATRAGVALELVPDSAALADRLANAASMASGLSMLTPTERQILAQLATHLTLEQIGESRYVSRATVKSHVASIYSKLGARTRAEAVSIFRADPTSGTRRA
jgi:LuxR family maltose regulon positive regulatory protein